MNKKYPAYTILEILIVMMLTGIVMGMAIIGFFQFENMLHSSRATLTKNNEYILFENTLNDDCYMAERILNDDPVLVIENRKGKLIYMLRNSYVTRRNGEQIDTFFLQLKNISIIEHEDLPGMVNNIQLEVLLNEEIYPVNIWKEYSNKQLYDFQLNNYGNRH